MKGLDQSSPDPAPSTQNQRPATGSIGAAWGEPRTAVSDWTAAPDLAVGEVRRGQRARSAPRARVRDLKAEISPLPALLTSL